MDDIKEIVIVWENRVVFKMVKKEDWVIVVTETIKKPKKKPSAAYRRLKRLHARSRAMVARR